MDTNKKNRQKKMPIPQSSPGDIIEKAQKMSENWIEKGFGKDIPVADKRSDTGKSKENFRTEPDYTYN